MSSNKIKVAGYSQKTFFGNGIEYRPFSPLVDTQSGTTLFTMGNFTITTNMDSKVTKNHNTKSFSNFTSLNDMNLTLDENKLFIDNHLSVKLNLDKTNINNYAIFGSFTEFIRVSLENIIISWPASLYITPNSIDNLGFGVNGNTFDDYTYDHISNISSFKINTNFIINKFGVNYLSNGTLLNTFNETNQLRDLNLAYSDYIINTINGEYSIIGFTGSTNLLNDYINVKVKGDPFNGISGNSLTYHILPNKSKQDYFFKNLSEFENYLLNRKITPKYTAEFKYPISTDMGILLYVTESVTWPTTDGYNIDFDTSQYSNYVNKLLEISNNNDLKYSDLINRFLVTESITSFDTQSLDENQDLTGQKINKLLRIYGREFDDLTKYINGIKFSNIVTYNKEDNTPDLYVKNLARVLGWDLISSIVDNNILNNYFNHSSTTYSGYSAGLTPIETDTEFWRRLILNTPWLWRSKGTRSSVEFLLKFLGIPNGLITFNEYVYKASNKIDINEFQKILELNNLDTDLTNYPIDADGYPDPKNNTPEMYFQNYGLWYRQTGGENSDIDLNKGNNPHIGTYDGGSKYIHQFNNLIPNFSAVTISSQTITTGTTNLYLNNDEGTFDNLSIYSNVSNVSVTGLNDENYNELYQLESTIETNNNLINIKENNCGCNQNSGTTNNNLKICLSKYDTKEFDQCGEMVSQPINDNDTGLYVFKYKQYNQDGTLFTNNGVAVPNTSNYSSVECCNVLNGKSFLMDTYYNGEVINSGFICCDTSNKCGCTISCGWVLEKPSILLPQLTSTYNGVQDNYLVFKKPDGQKSVVTPDGCNCIANYTTKVANVVDPFNNMVGYGCKLTQSGIADLNSNNSNIERFYLNKSNGNIGCYQTVLPLNLSNDFLMEER